MSARAYRINNIDIEDNPSFNLWHDKNLMDFLEKIDAIVTGENTEEKIEVEVLALKKAIKQAKKLKLEEYVIEAIKADIKWAEKKNDTYVQYYCF